VAGRGRRGPAGGGALADGVTRAPQLGDPRASAPAVASAVTRRSPPADHPQVFTGLKWTSFTHSCIYTALLICAFAAGKPQPETFILGLTHGLLWIGMSIACIVCVRLRIVPLRLATAVAVLGGIGPFFGSFEFVRETRRRETVRPPAALE
jgi:hypothetical protein